MKIDQIQDLASLYCQIADRR
ncbi:hypothetical protein F383_36765 [Gossypium arboreum]|uniref:Uncharacterized protein n=1 Tax=Gossypium arboreum TaxID=29729 RepID=A0A0B0M9F5_GOSAR|nr:hypothetical protein F383_36765 [Gossypium arboreum]